MSARRHLATNFVRYFDCFCGRFGDKFRRQKYLKENIKHLDQPFQNKSENRGKGTFVSATHWRVYLACESGMFVGRQRFSLAFYLQTLLFNGNLLLNSCYSETNPQLLCAFNADGSKTGFSSVHRSAVEPELIFVFRFSSFSFLFIFFFYPATEKLLICFAIHI